MQGFSVLYSWYYAPLLNHIKTRAAMNTSFKALDIRCLKNEYWNIRLYILYQLQAYKLIQKHSCM